VSRAFQASGNTLERLTKQRGIRPMRSLLEQAASDLERKVARLRPKDDTFTAVQLRGMLTQVRAMLLQLQPKMTRVLGETSREAQLEGVRDMMRTLAVGELAFEGVTTPLPFEEAARLAGIIDRDRASLLRQHDVSIRTYGMETIAEMEQTLAQSLATGEGYAATVAKLMDAVDGTLYRAERIVRTESSFAFSSATASALDEASEIVPGLMRQWVEHVSDSGQPLDNRVAIDSIVLHSQVCFQPEGASFVPRTARITGGTGGFEMPIDNRVSAKLWGQRYAHSPNRPNDRSTIGGWKPTWDFPAYMVVNGRRVDAREALRSMARGLPQRASGPLMLSSTEAEAAATAD
jgi:hypothetical protein